MVNPDFVLNMSSNYKKRIGYEKVINHLADMLPDFDSVGICKLSRSDSRERARNAVPATTQHLIHQPFPVAGTVGNETIGLSAVQSVARQTV